MWGSLRSRHIKLEHYCMGFLVYVPHIFGHFLLAALLHVTRLMHLVVYTYVSHRCFMYANLKSVNFHHFFYMMHMPHTDPTRSVVIISRNCSVGGELFHVDM